MVTAVLSIRGGLAIGGYAVGRRVDRVEKPLRLHGVLNWDRGSLLMFAVDEDSPRGLWPQQDGMMQRLPTIVRMF
jgi:hypothetical protein